MQCVMDTYRGEEMVPIRLRAKANDNKNDRVVHTIRKRKLEKVQF